MSHITVPARRAYRSALKSSLLLCAAPQRQRGVVLIIALILLVLISLLAVSSVRNAGSSESVAGNVRTSELATQAADIALRYCEGKAVAMDATGPLVNMLDQWKDAKKWDSPAAKPPWNNTSADASAFVLPLQLVNQAGTTYKRPPECMVEKQEKQNETLPLVTSKSIFYVITARGFGPQVAAADAARSRPVGSEVWLQSHIEIEQP